MMNEITKLQGSSGKIYVDSVNVKHLFRFLPFITIYAIVSQLPLITGTAWPNYVSFLLFVIFYACAFSFITVNIRYNNIHQIWSAEDVPFREYLGVLFAFICGMSLLFGPLFLFDYLFNITDNITGSFSSLDDGDATFTDFASLLSVVLVSAYLIMLAFCAVSLISASCYKIKELFSLSQWYYFIARRIGDFFLINTLLIGFFLAFLTLYIAPFLALLSFVNKHYYLTVDVTTYLITLPLFLSCIPLARWCGAYIMDTDIFVESYTPSFSDNKLANVNQKPAALDARKEPKVITHIKQIKTKNQATLNNPPIDDSAPDYQYSINSPKTLFQNARIKESQPFSKEIKQLSEQYAQSPGDSQLLIMLIKAYRKADRRNDVIAHANAGIAKAIHDGSSTVAVTLYQLLGKDKSALRLDPIDFSTLAELLEHQNQFTDAWRCYSRSYSDQNIDSSSVQSKLLELAKQAAATCEVKQAEQLYTHFLKKFPRSDRADFARNALDMLNITVQNH